MKPCPSLCFVATLKCNSFQIVHGMRSRHGKKDQNLHPLHSTTEENSVLHSSCFQSTDNTYKNLAFFWITTEVKMQLHRLSGRSYFATHRNSRQCSQQREGRRGLSLCCFSSSQGACPPASIFFISCRAISFTDHLPTTQAQSCRQCTLGIAGTHN